MKRPGRNGCSELLSARLLTLILRIRRTATIHVGDRLRLAKLLLEVLEQLGWEGAGTLPDSNHILKFGLLISGDDFDDIVHESRHELSYALYGGGKRSRLSSAFNVEVLAGLLRGVDPLANNTVYNIQRAQLVSGRSFLKSAVHALGDMLLGLDIGHAEVGDGADLIPTCARRLQLVEGRQHGLQITERRGRHDRECSSLDTSGEPTARNCYCVADMQVYTVVMTEGNRSLQSDSAIGYKPAGL